MRLMTAGLVGLVLCGLGVSASAREPKVLTEEQCYAAVERLASLVDAGKLAKAEALAEQAGPRCAPLGLKPHHLAQDARTRARNTALARDVRIVAALAETLMTLAVQGPEHRSTANRLRYLAVLHRDRGAYDEALRLYQRVLDIRERTLGPEHSDTVYSLSDLARFHGNRGAYDEALPLCRRALDISERVLGLDHPGTAASLVCLGRIHEELGEYEETLPLLRRALDISERALGPDHSDTANSLEALAWHLYVRGAYAEALPLYLRARDISERAYGPDSFGTIARDNNLALLYQAIGAHGEALKLFERRLDFSERVLGPDHPDVALSLHNLARLHHDLGAHDEALPLYLRALDVEKRVLGPDHPHVAISLHNLASLHHDLGAYDQALPLYLRALDVTERVRGPNHPRTGISLEHLARLHRDLGDLDAARPLLSRALLIALDATDFRVRTEVLRTALSLAAIDGHLAEAVLWGKLAVEFVERSRTGVASLGDDASDRFIVLHQDLYRELARVLARQGRLAEAEEVLGLLKRDELHRFARRDAGATGDARALFFAPEEDALRQRIDAAPRLSIAQARELDALRKIDLEGSLGPASRARLDELRQMRTTHTQAMAALVTELRDTMNAEGRAEEMARLGMERAPRLQRALRESGGDTVVIHAVSLPDELLLLLTTANAQVSATASVHAQDLAQQVLALREALRDASMDPRPAGQALYSHLLKPLEPHLAEAGATTLLLYLDGTLRYVPVAALHDGERFVAEKWATAVYTPAAELDFARPPTTSPQVAAFGTSRPLVVGGDSFSALPAVPGELTAIVGEQSGSGATVPGRRYLDHAFTKRTLSDELHRGMPWVHIASHFRFRPGTEADSYLLIGDGSALTVGELRLGDYPLAGVDLLALSACDTAMGGARADGSEVEGLAVIAQNAGAGAVLATLWPVADASTAAWMAELYRRKSTAKQTRALTVQQVQQAFLRGEVSPRSLPEAARGLKADVAEETHGPVSGLEGWRHPYYWAPFVLFGTGR